MRSHIGPMTFHSKQQRAERAKRIESERFASFDMEPIVSVIIPCYNRASLVTQAVRSVISQTYGHHQIIVVDDASTDDLEGALQPYRDKITYIRKLNNEGVSAARNDGLNAVTGEYVSFLDSDDIWLPNKTQDQLQTLLAHPNCGMAVSGCEYIDIDNRPILSPTLPDPDITYSDLCIYTAIPGSTSNVLIRRVVLDDVGGFDHSLHNGEDRDLWMRIAERYKVCASQTVTARIRVHGSARKNRDFHLMLANRRAINSRIKSPELRRKANAWMYFSAYMSLRGHPFQAIYYLSRSIACHPFPVHRSLNRLSRVIERILPRPVHYFLSKVKHAISA